MISDRMAGRSVGVLFIIGTVAGVLSVVLTQPIFGDPNLLGAVAANGTRLSLAALAVLVMGLSVAPIPVIVCSILPDRELALSLGAVDFLAKPVTDRKSVV